MATDDAVRILIGVLAALVLVPLLLVALMMPFGVMMMGYGGYNMGGWYGGLFGLVPLLVLVVLGWLGYRLLTGERGRDPAVGELREAYARGELSTEEFEERLERLGER